jgi:hypothetical protein
MSGQKKRREQIPYPRDQPESLAGTDGLPLAAGLNVQLEVKKEKAYRP